MGGLATPAILSFVSLLDRHGAASWNLRAVTAASAAVLYGIHVLGKGPDGKKRWNVSWDSLVHASVSGVATAMCAYLDAYAAEEISGAPEPIRSIRCEGPLTSLHRLVPAITCGYAIFDMIDGLSLGPAFAMHAAALALVMGAVCELGHSHTVTPMLLMELSSIPLNLTGATFLPAGGVIATQASFALLFFIVRIVIVPRIWYQWVVTFYEEERVEKERVCFPHFFIHIVLVFGVFFHSLNFYWFVKLVKKTRRKLSGSESMTDAKMN